MEWMDKSQVSQPTDRMAGLEWNGLDWTGLDWTGLVQYERISEYGATFDPAWKKSSQEVGTQVK